MKRKLRVTFLIVALTGIVGWLFFTPIDSSNRLAELQKKNSLSVNELAELRMLAKIEKRRNGWAKPDKPDEFTIYHNMIRTFPGDKLPGYPINYKIDQLEKARKRLNSLKISRRQVKTVNWKERGPWNVGGRTRSMLIDQEDSTLSTWIAGSVGGGIWKTTNCGSTWADLSPDFPNLAVTALAVSESNPQIIYSGTGEGFGNLDGIKGDGIFKSMDKGKTWTQLASTSKQAGFSYVNRMIVDPENENILVVVTKAGIYRTEDGGNTFKLVYNKSGNIYQQIIYQPGNFNKQYVSVKGTGVIRSLDGGITWMVTGGRIPGAGRIEIAATSLDSTLLYASVDEGNASALYRSQDFGVNWLKISILKGYDHWLGGQGWYNNAITIHPFNKNVVFVGGLNLHKIELNGLNGELVNLSRWYPDGGLPLVHADQHGLFTAILDYETKKFRLIVANDGGVEYSDDSGLSWKKTQNGYRTTQFYGVDKAPGSDEYFGGTQDNGSWLSPVWKSLSDEWKNVLTGDGFATAWHHKNPDMMMGSMYYNIVWRTKDHGKNWELMSSVADEGTFITTIAESNIDPDLLFVFAGTSVFRTENFGDTWSKVPFQNSGGGIGLPGTVKISVRNPQIVWAGSGMTTGSNSLSLQLSVDGGTSFQKVPGYGNIGFLSGFGTHPGKDSIGYALFSVAGKPKILKTENLGLTWTDLSQFSDGESQNGFPDVAVYSLIVMPFNPAEIWAGTEIGLFVSDDSGDTWHLAGNGIPSVAIWDMKIVDDQVVLATHGRGIWTATIPELNTVPLPDLVKPPKIISAFSGFPGNIQVKINFPVIFDSLFVYKNGELLKKFLTIRSSDTTIYFKDLSENSKSLFIFGYKNGWNYKSNTVTPVSMNLLAVSDQVSLAFNEPSDFSKFEISVSNGAIDFINMKPVGFPDKGLSTRHPYSVNSVKTAMLRIPIIVKNEHASLTFRDLVLVEPGEPGSRFGDENFNDYVIVEGTKNGGTWIPLRDGYNSNYDSDWLDFYKNKADDNPTANLIKAESFNLLNTFSAQDTILLRWRLSSNGQNTGWGWFIDDIEIQKNLVSVDGFIASPFELSLNQNYPNPFNPSTQISYSIEKSGLIFVAVFDALGRHVETLVNSYQSPGIYSVQFDGKSKSSGIYFLRMNSDGRQFTRKMILLK